MAGETAVGFCRLRGFLHEKREAAYRLVKDSPCARAGGAIEIRPIGAMNEDATPCESDQLKVAETE